MIKYPRKIYCSVLLVDGKVVDYKIGDTYWYCKEVITLRGQISWEDYQIAETRYTSWNVKDDTENENVFDNLAHEWMKQFK